MEQKLAIIDLGSNSVRMIVMQVFSNGSYKMVDHLKEMVRLSEGMGEDNILKNNAIERTVHVLKLYKRVLDIHNVDVTYALATAAVRNAENKDMFLNKVFKETGLNFEVISGEKEAYYDYLGVINTLDVDNCLLLDTGGGSSEIVHIVNRKPVKRISIPWGAVNLYERFCVQDDWNEEKVKSLEDFLKKELDRIDWLKGLKELPIVGLGGSIRALAKMYKKKEKINFEGLHNLEISSDELLVLFERLRKSSVDERREMGGIGKDRADIIISGMLPLRILAEITKSNKLIVSGNGLREGVFFMHYLKSRNEGEYISDILTASIDNILKNYDCNNEHCHLVEKLSLQMFDQLRDVHKMPESARKLLSTAALLHDIGTYVDYYNHHQHGFYLTLNSRLYGISNREIVMCAYLVAMHRDEDFKRDYREFTGLIKKSDYELVKKLSVFIKIAEELDRTEIGVVQGIKLDIESTQVKMTLITTKTAEFEKNVAMKSAKTFEKAFSKRLTIK